ncbi:MAG TPA: YedE family putative selenium transporter [Candidatus Limnocylindrales bacterium]|nr:YedE family putative selenium transporter [Candidatus Limnocylindrales bacterium]
MRDKLFIIVAGAGLGLLAVILAVMGNPPNMGFCIACFLRDIAGGLGLHRAEPVQYLRPEMMGLVLGSFAAAFYMREYRATAGSGPVLQFVLGMLMMAGALIFLGCPLRMILRLAGGDWNALVALPGYVLGVWGGTLFLKKGYTLGRSQEQTPANGFAGPIIALMLLLFLIARPAFIFFSIEGPGSMTAPLFISLGAGLLVGIMAQRTRLCTMGAVRDLFLFKDTHLFLGLAAIFLVVLVGNMVTGRFIPGFTNQPVAHTNSLWNFLGMTVVGLAAVLAGGCPMRHLILTGEGQGDSLITVMGMTVGAAFMHNFNLAGSPAGVPVGGQWAVIISLVFLVIIGSVNSAARVTKKLAAKAAG